MRKGKLFCVGIIPVLICTLALSFLTQTMELRDIENKVKEAAEAALNSPEFAWADIETFNRGRQVLITGTAPNDASIDAAILRVETADGVLSARHNGEPNAVITAQPARLDIKLQNRSVTLTGVVSSKSELDRLLSDAKQRFGASFVTSELTYSPTTVALSAPEILSPLYFDDTEHARLQMIIEGSKLRITGTVAEEEHLAHITQTLKGLPFQTLNQIQVVPVIDCAELVTQRLKTAKINFATARDEISATSHDLLDDIADIANTCPESRFIVIGHTDSAGNKEFNLKLSQRRAQAVVNYLLATGLTPTRFEAIGRGSQFPIADNNTESGRATNRRIEFQLRD